MKSAYATIGLALVLGFPLTSGAEQPARWQVGDLFIGVGDGSYQVFDRKGGLKQTLSDEQGGYTTGCGFSPDLERLYTTNYTHTKVVSFEQGPEPSLTQIIRTGAASPGGHSSSIVFDVDGQFFVGHPDGNHLVHKYNDAGMLAETYKVQSDQRGPVSLDLAADQSILYYTSIGRTIRRYDTATNHQLENFAELPDEGDAAALRLLPPGDGTGGLLVADGYDIKRLDADGEVVQVYDAPEQDEWFALNLDPNGTSFWAADSETDELYRFDIGTGTIERQFQAGEGASIFGVCVRGELTAGTSQAGSLIPSAYSLSQNAPNPFNPSTQIEYQLPHAGPVKLVVYNLLGQQIRTLETGEREVGVHRLTWEGMDDMGRAVSSGVYLYRFESDGLQQTRRMVLLK